MYFNLQCHRGYLQIQNCVSAFLINKNGLYLKKYNSYVTIIHYNIMDDSYKAIVYLNASSTSKQYMSMLLWLLKTKFAAQNGNCKLNIYENMLKI